jgi:hypothetical protein
MHDLRARHQKLLVDAADCEMIGALASDAEKRETFRRLAQDLRKLAEDLHAEIIRRGNVHMP